MQGFLAATLSKSPTPTPRTHSCRTLLEKYTCCLVVFAWAEWRLVFSAWYVVQAASTQSLKTVASCVLGKFIVLLFLHTVGAEIITQLILKRI